MAMQFKKTLINLAVCSAVAGLTPTAVFAQEAEVVDEIVVTGMRGSIESAQSLKRNADTVKDVITATDIGALPDKSVTEALQRVPGVTIERFAASEDPNHFADEGTGVLVRGLDRVRSEVNGRGSFSANPWGGLNYEDISPELLASVEVVKNQTADVIAGGIAGTVNLVTRKPFDSNDRIIGATVKANYADFRDEWTPSFSGLFSDRWDTAAGEFGFLISASASEHKTRGDGVGVANYYSRGAGAGLDGGPLAGQTEDVLWMPGQFSIRTAENDRKREGYSTSFQWQNLDETIVATVEYLRSDASLTWYERVIGSQEQGFNVGNMTLANVTDVNVAPVFGDDGFFQRGEVVTHGDVAMLYSSRYNDTSNRVEDSSFNLVLKPNDKLKIELDYQHINSTQKVINNGVNGRVSELATNAILDVTGSRPTLEFVDEKAGNGEDVIQWGSPRVGTWLATALDQNSDSDAKADSYKLDLEYEIDSGWARSVKAGVYHSDKDLTIRDTEYSNWGALNFGWEDPHRAASTPLNPAAAGEWEIVDFGDFYKDKNVLRGDVTSFYFPKMDNAKYFTEFTRRICESGVGNGGFGGSAYPQTNPNCMQAQIDLANRVDGSVYAPFHITSTNEQRSEAYVRFDFGNDELNVPIKGNVGLRYVNYKLQSAGYTILPDLPGGQAAAIFAAQYPNIVEFVETAGDSQGQYDAVDGTDYSTVLPSLNISASLTDDLILRFGASKGLYFPTMDLTRNSRVLSLTYETVGLDPTQPVQTDPALPGYNPIDSIENVGLNGVARNTYLEPEESVNLDLSLEWYFSSSNSLTVSLFHKKIDNLFRERTFFADVTNELNGATERVSFVGPDNDGSGSIQGFELSYTQFFDMLPGAWSGLGVQANYTYIDQKDLNDETSDEGKDVPRTDSAGNAISDSRNSFRAFGNLPLPGYSDENLNLTGMYIYNDLEVRLAYNWRSEYLVTRRDSNEFAPIYADDAGYLDASIFYTINDNLKIGLEATNLLDTETKTKAQYNSAGDTTDALNFITDKRYAVTLRMNF